MVITDQETLDKLIKTFHLMPVVFRPTRIMVTFDKPNFNNTNYYIPALEGFQGEYELNKD